MRAFEGNTYRAGRLSGCLLLIGGLPFLAIGLCGLIAVGLESWYFFGLFFAAGLFAVVLGLEAPSRRLVVDGHGITQTFWFGAYHEKMPWETIESWLATAYDITPELDSKVWASLYPGETPWFRPVLLGHDGSFTGKAALFRIQGRRWPVRIQDSEQWDPNFDAFLADVRTWIQSKEIAVPELCSKVLKPKTAGNT